MKTRAALITLPVILLLLMSLPTSAQDAASLRAAIERHYTAINSGETEVVWEHHRPDMSIFPGNGTILVTDQDLQAGQEQGAALPFADDTNVFVNDFAAQIYDNVGVATFYLVGSVTTDEVTTRATWRVTAVWVYEDGEWREAHHHESPLAPL